MCKELSELTLCLYSLYVTNYCRNHLTFDMIGKCCRAFTSNYAAPSADEAALVQPSTDGKEIPLAGVNDYAGQILKVTT